MQEANQTQAPIKKDNQILIIKALIVVICIMLIVLLFAFNIFVFSAKEGIYSFSVITNQELALSR